MDRLPEYDSARVSKSSRSSGSLSSVNVSEVWGRVRSYVRSAPLTYAWLVVLLATTLVQHSLSARVLRTLLQSTSTNLHHLASDPLRVLVNSLLWIDGSYWWPYVLIFTLFLAPAERWLGHLRWLVAGLVCHVGATVLSEGFLYWSIQQAKASPRLIDARDVGVSYFVVGIAGLLFYRIPRRWRWLYLGALVAVAVGATGRPHQLHVAGTPLRAAARAGLLPADVGPSATRCGLHSGCGDQRRRPPTSAPLRGVGEGRRSTRATSRSAHCSSMPTAWSASRTAT